MEAGIVRSAEEIAALLKWDGYVKSEGKYADGREGITSVIDWLYGACGPMSRDSPELIAALGEYASDPSEQERYDAAVETFMEKRLAVAERNMKAALRRRRTTADRRPRRNAK